MNTLARIATLLILFILFSCNNQESRNQFNSGKNTELSQVDSTQGLLINYDEVIVVDRLRITNRNGADIFQQPYGGALKIMHFDYGREVEIISDENGFYGIRERITRDLVSNEKDIERTAWEKVYIKTSQLGELSEIRLENEDLYIHSYSHIGHEEEFQKTEKQLNEIVKIELVDEGIYSDQKRNNVSHLSRDSLYVNISKGSIEILCSDTVVLFVDNPGMEEDEAIFEYVGEIASLGLVLVSGTYWENNNYKLVNVKNGITHTFSGYPYISSDLKYVVSFAIDPYDQSVDFELFKVHKSSETIFFKEKLIVGFTNWMPTFSENQIFFGGEYNIYVPVNHSEAYWDEYGAIKDAYQYLRISIL